MSNGEYSSVASRIRELCYVIEDLRRYSGELGLKGDVRAESWYQSLFQHLRPRVEGQPYLLVAVVGGTNTGKSTIVNQLAGVRVSKVSHLACHTKQPVCIAPQGFFKNTDPKQVFPGFKVRDWQSDNDATDANNDNLLFIREDETGRQPSKLLLLDTPDVDGCVEINWDRARAIRQAADVLVGVLTDEKYNDWAVRQFFKEADLDDKPVILVFNKVDWPDQRDRCHDWLNQFCHETHIEPLNVYAAPRDERAGENLQLRFQALSSDATDLRDDLTKLQFERIQLRTFRGALGRVLNQGHGVPQFLGEIERKSGEFGELRNLIQRKVALEIGNVPTIPNHIIVDELWDWLEQHRTRFDRWVHHKYSWVGKKLLFPLKRLFGSPSPEQLDEEYKRKDYEALHRSLAHALDDFDTTEELANETVQREIRDLMGGVQREEIFEKLKLRHAELPLVTTNYRQFVAKRAGQFASDNPKTLLSVKAVLVGTAVIRPVITIVLCGGPELVHQLTVQAASHAAQEAAAQAAMHVGQVAAEQAAAHAAQEAAAQVATQTATHVTGDVAVGAAVAFGTDTLASKVSDQGLRKLLQEIVTQFYSERSKLLGQIVNAAVGEEKVSRIARLADVQQAPAMQSARQIVSDLRTKLGNDYGLGATRTDDRIPAAY